MEATLPLVYRQEQAGPEPEALAEQQRQLAATLGGADQYVAVWHQVGGDPMEGLSSWTGVVMQQHSPDRPEHIDQLLTGISNCAAYLQGPLEGRFLPGPTNHDPAQAVYNGALLAYASLQSLRHPASAEVLANCLNQDVLGQAAERILQAQQDRSEDVRAALFAGQLMAAARQGEAAAGSAAVGWMAQLAQRVGYQDGLACAYFRVGCGLAWRGGLGLAPDGEG